MKPCVPWLCAVLLTAFCAPRLCGAPDAGTKGNTPEAAKDAMNDYDAGLALLKANRHNEALAAFRNALEKAEAVKEPVGRTVASVAANNAGNLLMLQNKASDAETLFRRAVAADPKHALAINNLGVALLKQGKTQEALQTFEQAVKTDPRQGLALNNLASLLIQAGNLKLAAKHLATSLKLNPKNQRQTLLLTARLYDKADSKPEAQDKLWQSLVNTTDGSPDARLHLACEYLQAGLFPQAERVFNGLLKEKPEWPEAQYNLGRLLVISKTDFERGVRLLTTASSGSGETAEQAKKFLADIESLSKGGDPEWKAADAKKKERR